MVVSSLSCGERFSLLLNILRDFEFCKDTFLHLWRIITEAKASSALGSLQTVRRSLVQSDIGGVFRVDHKTIFEIAGGFGLELEGRTSLPGNHPSFRIYKGAKRVFEGTEQEVRQFFARYEKERPGLLNESMYGARE